MSRAKLLRKFLILLIILIPTVCGLPGTEAQDDEKRPQIDVEDYSIDAELFPSSHQIKVKTTVEFKAIDAALSYVIFDFNANLKLDRVYFSGKPPLSNATSLLTGSSLQEAGSSPQTEVPYLSRGKSGAKPTAKTASKKKGSASEATPPAASDPNQLRFSQSAEDHTLRVDFNSSLAQSQSATLVLEYGGTLKSSDNSPLEGVQVASIDEDVSYLLAISRWFPMNRYMRDRATATFRITVPEGYVVAMEGTSKDKDHSPGKDSYSFTSERATYPGSLAVAKYNVMPVTVGNVEITFFVKDNKRDYINAQSEVIGKILELFGQKFGPYPSKSLKVAVIDNDSLLGYSAPGIQFLADRAFESTPNSNLLAREISYQWWQNLIVPKSPRDLWLKEGFAGYSALLYQESISGEAGFVKELKDTAVAALLHEDKSTIRNAYQLQEYSPEYNSILKSKGAYVLHMLRGVLGDENFFKLMKDYVYEFGYKEASLEDFKALAEKVSGQNLTYFFSQWIDQNGVPQFEYEYTTYRIKEGFKVTGVIKQDLDTFRMPVEILVETDGKPELKKVDVVGPETNFALSVFGKPKTAKIDPSQRILRISDDIRVSILIAKGDELRKLGEPTEAIAQYQKAIELNKRSSLALFRIGEAFFEQRSYNSAANSFREALNGDLDPKWLEVWCHINLGRIYDVLTQRERALKEYQQALDTNDNAQGAQETAQKHIQEPYKPENTRTVVQ
jgi:tetratricopeptide (TPR) repeat protein